MGWGWGLIDLMIPWMRVVDGVKEMCACETHRPVDVVVTSCVEWHFVTIYTYQLILCAKDWGIGDHPWMLVVRRLTKDCTISFGIDLV